jgi:hypothetical protein
VCPSVSEAESSGEPLRGPAATSKPAVEISAKGKNESAFQILPEAKPILLSLGSVILTHHCRELALLTHLQQEEDWDN